MDKKIASIVSIAILVLAGACAYTVLGSDSEDRGSGSESGSYVLALNGVIASNDTVSDGIYSMKRNLVLVTNGEPTGNVKCFLDWITSSEGQAIVSEEFVSLNDSEMTIPSDPVGSQTITVGGSTSIMETMSVLAEAYMAKYSGITIAVNGGGSGAGASGAINGNFDIGMLSRDPKVGELEQGLVPTKIGVDGVAIIANAAGVTNLSTVDLAKIYSGEYTNWSQLGGDDRPIGVISREDGSGTRECFDNTLSAAVDGWSMKDDVVKFNNTAGVINLVSKTPGAIGYISVGKVGDI